MELEAVSKYINLNRLANGCTEVVYAGQPCLVVSEIVSEGTFCWKINPVFAKLVSGINIFHDIPMCRERQNTIEEAIASGISALYDLGAFKTAVDIPDDTFAVASIQDDIRRLAVKNSDGIMEAVKLQKILTREFETDMFMMMETRSEWVANDALATTKLPDPKKSYKPKFHLDSPDGKRLSSHDTEGDAVRAFKDLPNQRGIKIVRESEEGLDDVTPIRMFSEFKQEKLVESKPDASVIPAKRTFVVHTVDASGKKSEYSKDAYSPRGIKRTFTPEPDDVHKLVDITHNGVSVMNESEEHDDSDARFEKWKSDVRAEHPSKEFHFKGIIDKDGTDTISAHDKNDNSTDKRAYGVWDNDKNEGHVFKLHESVLTQPEVEKREEIVRAVKGDKKFQSKYDKDFSYKVSTEKESA